MDGSSERNTIYGAFPGGNLALEILVLPEANIFHKKIVDTFRFDDV